MRLLILGANSDIAHAIARKFAKEEHADFYLASRNTDLLEKKAKDLMARYSVKAEAVFFDANDFKSHEKLYNDLVEKPTGVVVAFGYMSSQEKVQSNFNEVKKIVDSNFLGAVSILEIIAKDFENNSQGFIIGISSVAGERGRQSNYIYGSVKAAFSTYLGGLRNRLSKKKCHVMTVLPGYVKTKMTSDLDLPGIITAEPSQVADDVYNAYKKGKDIIFTRWYWWVIIKLIKLIPEKIFKKLSL